jgi:nucleoside-diphosphate-sugar epimerase
MRLPAADLRQVTQEVLANGGDALAGTTILITGGSGFLGRWLVETFCAFTDLAEIDARMLVLTRDASRFREHAPHLAQHRAITVIEGDLMSLANGSVARAPEHCDFVIHGATEPASRLEAEPHLVPNTISMTRDALEFSVAAGTRRFLYLSSGAVYGRQPADLALIPEEYTGSPDVSLPSSAYGETKRVGELLCASYARKFGIEPVIARGFSLIGPHIPMSPKFAAGEFLSSALAGDPIAVRGDGTPVRSYAYAAEFTAWLWTILLRGRSGRAYNVGSEEEVSIASLANAAAALRDPPMAVTVATAPASTLPDRHVPSMRRARSELGLEQSIGWKDALRRTYDWLRETHSRFADGDIQ